MSAEGIRGPIPRLLLLLLLLAWPVTSASADELNISGFNELRWRARSTGGVDDQDLHDTVVLDGRSRGYGFYIHANALHDLEGLAPKDSPEPFAGLPDTYKDRTHGKLYSAYVDLGGDPAYGRPFLRVGRQWRYRAETLQFDGATATLRLGRFFDVEVLGGQPVHLYESSPDGDRVAGASARLRFFRVLELGADALRLRDERVGLATVETDVLQTSAVVRLGEPLVLRGESSWADRQSRRASLRGSLDLDILGLWIDGAVVRQEESLEDLVTEVSPYYQVLGVSRPYESWMGTVRKSIGEGLDLEVGAAVRRLVSDSDESPYNHDYKRGYVSILMDNALLGFDVDLTAEGWSSTNDKTGTGSVSVKRKLGKTWSLEGGSEYALYKYDIVTAEERDYVRTWYVRLGRKAAQGWGCRLGWEVEEDDDKTYQVIDLSVRRSF